MRPAWPPAGCGMQRDLVTRATNGDHDAFAILIEGAFDRLTRTARLILRDDDAASDAVQDALVAAWVHIRAIRDPDRFDAWLHRLVVNACYSAARRRKRRGVIEIHVEAFDAASTGDSQGATAIHDQLERGFRVLTPEQRAVLVVHHYLGMPDGEAATVLGVPVGTYKSRLNRATAALRAALDADDRTSAPTREAIA
jgi:RNA polymerase sigma-70 factor (ECF subfamily)